MKLILTSSEFSLNKIKEKLEEFTGKPLKEINVAILNEASAIEKGDKRWLISGLCEVSKFFGGEDDFNGVSEYLNLLDFSLLPHINRDNIFWRMQKRV